MTQDAILPANLHYFHAAAREGSFHGAARVCVVSQPTISKAVQSLEAELGVPLFDRIKHRVYLTAAGRLLAQLCGDLELKVSEFRTALEEQRSGPPHGPVRLAALRTMGTGILPELAAAVAAEFPQIALSFAFAAPGEIHDMIRLGSADLGVVPGPSPPDLERRSLGRDDAMLVAAPASRLGDRLTQDELAGLALILTSRQNPWFAEHLAPFFSARSLEPQVVMEVDQGEAILALVEKDLGASIVPGHLAAGAIMQGRLRRVDVQGGLFSQDLEIVRLKGRSVSPAAAAVAGKVETISGEWLAAVPRAWPAL